MSPACPMRRAAMVAALADGGAAGPGRPGRRPAARGSPPATASPPTLPGRRWPTTPRQVYLAAKRAERQPQPRRFIVGTSTAPTTADPSAPRETRVPGTASRNPGTSFCPLRPVVFVKARPGPWSRSRSSPTRPPRPACSTPCAPGCSAELTEPASAATLAARVGLTRQKVNYHLRALERHRLVAVAEERQWGGLTERLLIASAASYVVSPSALGRSAPAPTRPTTGSRPATSSRWRHALVKRGGRHMAGGTHSRQTPGDAVHRHHDPLPVPGGPRLLHPGPDRGGRRTRGPLPRRHGTARTAPPTVRRVLSRTIDRRELRSTDDAREP